MGYLVYFILFATCGVLTSVISSKNKEIDKSKNIISDLSKSKKELESKVDILNKEVIQKEQAIKSLKSTIKKLDKELETYTEIERDSLKLNVEENYESKDDNSELNSEKQKIYDYMCDTKNNLFITGKAGTGKSFLLKYYRQHTTKNVLYTAPTGVAALNINGVTLHSAFGFDNLKDNSEIKLSANKQQILKKLDVLIIDEISMVRVDVFNQIDRILKYVNKNNLPFGGKQIILFGDLFQLPPVVKSDEEKYLLDNYGGVFFFDSPAYKNGNFKFGELEKVFRQDEEKFISILNHVREGNVTEEDIKTLNKRYSVNVPRHVAQIVPKKDEAFKINENNLNKLNSKEYIYQANITFGKNNVKETDFPCDFDLKLKVGALVMIIVNDQEEPRRWVNGTLGIISKLSDDEITVTINSKNYTMNKYVFSKYKCEYDEETKKMEYIVEASVEQFPVILAYAITIHKSQGMTYQTMACNLDNCFAPGQAYVALSRCAKFDGLTITSKVTPKSIITDKKVIDYYLQMKKREIK